MAFLNVSEHDAEDAEFVVVVVALIHLKYGHFKKVVQFIDALDYVFVAFYDYYYEADGDAG